MIPWEFIDSSPVPGGGGELRLYRRGREYSIMVNGSELMNSRAHGSEEALAELACARIADRPCQRVLIGGLGMGYTTAEALRRIGAGGRVVVAELVPAVVEWNRGPLADLAGHPLEDARVTVREIDVARIIQSEERAYDAILLDVDNGPVGMTRRGNDRLYSRPGLDAAFAALRPGGVLAVWSAGPDQAFTRLLGQAGFEVDEVRVRARGPGKGERHTIWLAKRGA
ncbi:MAG: hypothetical protein HYV06_08040 [Deltaproteobacteria bacterium]|nr:hypothetical protein [Deltaproteobacteria bacterium]